MNMLARIYQHLPPIARQPLRDLYLRLGKGTNDDFLASFVDRFFDSKSEYELYAGEIEEEAIELYNTHILPLHKEYTNSSASIGVGNIPIEVVKRYYALVRKFKPDTVVETGVANGFSTYGLLAAIDANNTGHLYSIDQPFYADENETQYRDELHYDTPCVDAIPPGKEPGWVVPDVYRGHWTFRQGLSQQEFPRLIVEEIDKIDMFLHDSEHSFPCMMFEFELAYRHLHAGGIMISDDISMTDAFDRYTAERDGEAGHLHRRVGYFIPR